MATSYEAWKKRKEQENQGQDTASGAVDTSRYDEWKKRKEQETSSQPDTSRYEAWKKRKQESQSISESTTNQITDKLNSYLGNTQSFYDTYNARYKDGSNVYRSDSADWLESVRSQTDALSAEAKELKNLIYSNYDSLDSSFIDEVGKILRGNARGRKGVLAEAERDNEFYSGFESEEDYIRSALEAREERQRRYEENKQRLDELKNGDFDWTDYSVRKQRADDIAALEAEISNYERGTDGYISKTVDDYYGVMEKADFGTTSVKRNYTNPSRDDLIKRDAMVDSTSWYTDANGKLRDVFGNEINPYNTDNEGNIIHPYAQSDDYKITDRLGMFWNASDEEIQEAAGTPIDTEGTWETVIKDGVDGSWGELTKNEIAIYYYLLNTNGQEAADKYLFDMKTELNRRQTMSDSQRYARGFDKANALEKIALSVATTPANLFGGMVGAMENTAYNLVGKEINPYSAAHAGMYYSNTVRSKQADELDETGARIPVVDFTLGDLYQTGMSILDSYASIGIGGKFGNVLLATSGATSEASRLYEQGASSEQIAWGSALVGAAELVSEGVSIGNLIDMKDAKSVYQIVTNILIQGGIEASEEGVTEIANTLTNAIVMGNQSDWAKLVEANGGDETKAFMAKVRDVSHAALGGFFSGTGSSSIPSAASYAANQMQFAEDGRRIRNTDGGVDALKVLAMEMAGNSSNRTQKSLAKQASMVTSEVSEGRGLGRLLADIQNTNRDTTVGRLYDAVGTAITEQGAADIAKSLERKGFSAKQAKSVAEAIAAAADGTESTDKQRKVLAAVENDSRVQKVISDVVENSMSTANQRIQKLTEFNVGVALNSLTKAADTTTQGNQSKAAPADVEGSVDDMTAASAAAEQALSAAADTQAKPSRAVLVDGKATEVAGIESVKDGEITYRLDDGRIVNGTDVVFQNNADAQVYQTIESLELSAREANALLEQYHMGEVNGIVFANGIQEAFTYGKVGIPKQDAMARGSFIKDITPTQVDFAYQSGVEARKAETARKQAEIRARAKQATAKKKGNVTVEADAGKLSRRQKVSISALEKVAEAMGINFVLFESAVDENGHRLGENGRYDPKTDTIYIDLYAGKDGQGTILFTAAHELTHFIKEWSLEKFEKLADFLVKQYGGKGVSVAELVAAQKAKASKANIEIGDEVAFEEFVSDSMETMLMDGKVLAKLKQQDQSLWEKIRDYIADLAAKIRAVYMGMKPDSAEGRYVAEMNDAIEEIRNLFTEGLIDARENYQGTEKSTTQEGGELRYHLRTYTQHQKDNWRNSKRIVVYENTEQLQLFIQESLSNKSLDKKLYFGAVSTDLARDIRENTGIDVEGYNLSLGANEIRKIMKDHGDETREAPRGQRAVTTEDLAHVLDVVQNPASIERSDKLYNGKPAIIFTGEHNGRMNVVAVVSDKRLDLFVQTVYINTKKGNLATPIGEQAPINTPEASSGTVSSDNSIFRNGWNVNKKISRQTTEEQNNTTQDSSEARYSLRDVSVPTWEELERKPPVRVIDISKPQTEGSFAQRRKQILTKAEEVMAQPYRNADTGVMIFLTEKSYTHAFNNLGDLQLNAAEHLPELIENAVLTHAEKPTHGSEYADGVYTFFAAARAGQVLPVKLKVKEYGYEGQILPKNIRDYFGMNPGDYASAYDTVVLEVEEIEESSPGSARDIIKHDIAPGPEELSTITVAELLDLVKADAQKYVPARVVDQEVAKFSLRDPDYRKVANALQKENEKLKGDVEHLKELLKIQRTVTNGTKFSKASLDGAASGLLKKTGAKGTKTELIGLLEEFYAYLAKSQELTLESIKEAAQPAIDWLLEHRQPTGEQFVYEAELTEQEILSYVYDSYWMTSTIKTFADVKQKQINKLRYDHMKRMEDLREQHKTQVWYLKQEHKAAMEEARKQHRADIEAKQAEIRKQYQDSRKNAIDSRNRTQMRHKIQKVVKKLNDLLLNETKDRHVPESMKKAVADALEAVNMDTVGTEERIAKIDEQIAKAKSPEKIAELALTRDRIQKMGERFHERITALRNAYAAIKDAGDSVTANAFDEVIAGRLDEVIDLVGETPLRNMSMEQLEAVYDMYKMVAKPISTANKTFKLAKSESIQQLGESVKREIREVGGSHKMTIKALEGVKGFAWNALKPVYAFRLIGSKTFTELYENLRSGEDTWAVDVTEAKDFFSEQSRKYKYESWDFKKQHSFQSTTGKKFDLSLEQIMSLYAYSKREQADMHLQKGGFVFDSAIEVTQKKHGVPVKYKVNTANAYNLSKQILANIIDTLTPEQRAFVDVMQGYLSDVMGAKGNEVSMAMYDIKLFKEKNYFPLKSAKQFVFEKSEAAGEIKLKNSGFSKKTVVNASNPVILSNFLDVWANHVNDMSMYHAFVLPLEDFNRVYNYNSANTEESDSESVKSQLQNAYGEQAGEYIKQLLTDLNGGARVDKTAGVINSLMAKFKKGAVFASASVVIQQPSAIARAMAVIDARYFIGPRIDKKRHQEMWSEVKKYAPVAIIKEMGYFDTNMGRSTVDFIKAKEYRTIGEKTKAVFADSDYRDELLSKAPAFADEVSWVYIWDAVKRETAIKNPQMGRTSEEFLKLAGKRFTEVITQTQVYDSVLSRSAMMRSKDTGMKMATAFMAEPTTSMNMIADAIIQGKRGNKKYARAAIGAVIASQILNAVLVSFVYAARDDDEDKTYWEKYASSVVGKILDGLNPMAYIPFVKDIVSIVQGYEVERSDMAVISDLWNAWKQLESDNVSVYRKVENFGGSIAQLFGLPVKNIMRDIRAIYQVFYSSAPIKQGTVSGFKYALMESLPEFLGGGVKSNQQQLYEAYINGDMAHAARVEARYKDSTAVAMAIRAGLRENDPRIPQAAIARIEGDLDGYLRIVEEIKAEGHFKQDYIVGAINTEINSMNKGESGTSTSKTLGVFKAEDFATAISSGDMDIAGVVKDDIIETAKANGKSQEDAEKYFKTSATGACKEAFLDGEMSEAEAESALAKFCGYEEDEASEKVSAWRFESTYGFAYSDREEAYKSGTITRSEMKKLLMEAGGKSAEDAETQLLIYDWEMEVPGVEDITKRAIEDYQEYCEGAGIDKETYYNAWVTYNETPSDYDSDGDTIPYSKVPKVMEYIDNLPLSAAQKTALAMCWWSESTVRKYKIW